MGLEGWQAVALAIVLLLAIAFAFGAVAGRSLRTGAIMIAFTLAVPAAGLVLAAVLWMFSY